MPQEGQRTRIAVLIDCDNAAPRHAEAIFIEIAKLGEAIVRRAYGDFSSQLLRGWNERIAPHALIPVQAVAHVKGKNSSDMALAIDAMDLMHSGLYDAFCIISSDSDFTRLAQRLRESGAEVYGFGEGVKTPASFRQACRRFFIVENLARDQALEAEREPELGLPATESQTLPAEAAIATISRAYDHLAPEHADGWVPIRLLHRMIANFSPDFDSRTYGQERLGDLAERTGRFETKHMAERKWCIRAKPRKPTQTRGTQGGGRKPAANTTETARKPGKSELPPQANDGVLRTIAVASPTRVEPAPRTRRRKAVDHANRTQVIKA